MPTAVITPYDPNEVVTRGILREELLELSAVFAKSFEQLITEFKAFKAEMYEFKREMYEFRDEMYRFKDEMYRFREEMYGFREEMYGFKEKVTGDLDFVMGELQTIRDEVAIMAYRSADHSDRIEALEKLQAAKKLSN